MQKSKLFFEDFEVGLVIKTGSKKITKKEIKTIPAALRKNLVKENLPTTKKIGYAQCPKR